MEERLKVVLTGGGTAGHIIPALTVKKALEKKINHLDVLYIGSLKSMEEAMAKEEGVTFAGICTGKLRRYFDWKNFTDPFRIILGIFQSIRILWKYEPDVVFSKGGYVAVPVGIAAFFLRIPFVSHESDLKPGLASKVFSLFAKKICVSFKESEGSFKNAVFTGSPIRNEIITESREEKEAWRKRGFEITEFDEDLPVILVLGGSLGAENIVKKIYALLPKLEGKAQVILQTGKGKLDAGQSTSKHLYQSEFIGEEMKYFYETADIVVSRAGANTLFELATLAKPSILIPLSKTGSRGDQILNAKIFQKENAVLVHDDNAPKEELLRDITKLLRDPSYRSHLSVNIRQFSCRNAAEKIAEVILTVAS